MVITLSNSSAVITVAERRGAVPSALDEEAAQAERKPTRIRAGQPHGALGVWGEREGGAWLLQVAGRRGGWMASRCPTPPRWPRPVKGVPSSPPEEPGPRAPGGAPRGDPSPSH